MHVCCRPGCLCWKQSNTVLQEVLLPMHLVILNQINPHVHLPTATSNQSDVWSNHSTDLFICLSGGNLRWIRASDDVKRSSKT